MRKVPQDGGGVLRGGRRSITVGTTLTDGEEETMGTIKTMLGQDTVAERRKVLDSRMNVLRKKMDEMAEENHRLWLESVIYDAEDIIAMHEENGGVFTPETMEMTRSTYGNILFRYNEDDSTCDEDMRYDFDDRGKKVIRKLHEMYKVVNTLTTWEDPKTGESVVYACWAMYGFDDVRDVDRCVERLNKLSDAYPRTLEVHLDNGGMVIIYMDKDTGEIGLDTEVSYQKLGRYDRTPVTELQRDTMRKALDYAEVEARAAEDRDYYW